MPLIKDILKQQLGAICDEGNPLFTEFPSSWEIAGQRWAQAINIYASAVIPASATSALAQQMFVTTWIPMREVENISVIATCVQSYASVLATGMVSSGFTGVPPVTPLMLDPVYNLGVQSDQADPVLELLATTIDTWFKTGTAVNIITGATVLWT